MDGINISPLLALSVHPEHRTFSKFYQYTDLSTTNICKNRTTQPSTHPSAMAEAFLAKLPRVGRGKLAKEDQRCFICMEDYGTTASASGIIERAVKLPCNHIMGSECISTWVSPPAQGDGGNNTCPICRRVLFDVQTAPTPPSMHAEHIRIHAVLVNQVVNLSGQLRLNTNITRMARWISYHIHERSRFENSNHLDDRPILSIAAACVFMASHLLRDPRPLGMITNCVADSDDNATRQVYHEAIARAYVLLHRARHVLIDTQFLAHLGIEVGAIDEVLPTTLY